MEMQEIIQVLQAGQQPDALILLDDGEFYIEHNCNYPVESGNGFLQKRVPVSFLRPGGYSCLGSYELKAKGWDVIISQPTTGDSDCERLGIFPDRLQAIATLWLARHRATE